MANLTGTERISIKEQGLGKRQLSYVVGILLFVLLAVSAFALWYSLSSDPPHGENVIVASSQRLSATKSAINPSGPPQIPNWLVSLIAVFAALQLIALLIAAQKARTHPLSVRDVKVIGFLCEIPMYIGLLGSLLGICLNQFITGSLAAPLAYMTTISGIILFLFAKLAIWTTLPEDYLAQTSE